MTLLYENKSRLLIFSYRQTIGVSSTKNNTELKRQRYETLWQRIKLRKYLYFYNAFNF
jgi:hypothetical protein